MARRRCRPRQIDFVDTQALKAAAVRRGCRHARGRLGAEPRRPWARSRHKSASRLITRRGAAPAVAAIPMLVVVGDPRQPMLCDAGNEVAERERALAARTAVTL